MATWDRRRPDDAGRVEAVVPGPRERPWLWLLLAVVVLAAWTFVRPEPFRDLVLPLVADVLGHDAVRYKGDEVSSEYTWAVKALIAATVVPLLLAGRSAFVLSRFKNLRWAARVRLDAAFLLAVSPYLALLPLWAALADSLLFKVPWAFWFVEPVSYLFLLLVLFVSLALALWVEHGGMERSLPRFGSVLLFLFVVEVVWVRFLSATTTAVPVWGWLVPPVVAYGVFFGVTLGHRLISHRRVLFALAAHHLAFFGMFLLLWLVQGPWPPMEWSYRGVEAVRSVGDARPWFSLAVVLPPVAVTVGLFTVGTYLQGYVRALRPWRDGSNVAMVFSQVLHGWVVTMATVDPYGALESARPLPSRVVGFLVRSLDGWGYFAAKAFGVVFVVFLLDTVFRNASWLAGERRNFVKLVVITAGLVPALRVAIRLGVGL
ncbi:MAG: DUF63 family protein [Euryarchaeota archaeon]|nr:DUF63 family protein [Euryarchaeota archaeon]